MLKQVPQYVAKWRGNNSSGNVFSPKIIDTMTEKYLFFFLCLFSQIQMHCFNKNIINKIPPIFVHTDNYLSFIFRSLRVGMRLNTRLAYWFSAELHGCLTMVRPSQQASEVIIRALWVCPVCRAELSCFLPSVDRHADLMSMIRVSSRVSGLSRFCELTTQLHGIASWQMSWEAWEQIKKLKGMGDKSKPITVHEGKLLLLILLMYLVEREGVLSILQVFRCVN